MFSETVLFLSRIILSFAAYSLLGWACESIYCSIPAKKFINRGFLNGPFCPVYGVGALLVIFLLTPFSQNVFILFIFGVLVTSVLEYATGFLLEKLFHTKWWDYSKHKFQLHGRICLKNSLMFGVLAVLLLYFINPFVERLEDKIPQMLLPVLAGVFLCYFIADTVITVRSILSLNGKLDELEKILEALKEKGEENRERFQRRLEDRMNATREAMQELEASSREKLQEKRENISRVLNSGGRRRLLKAFPTMKAGSRPRSLMLMREILEQKRKKDRKKK